MIGGINGAMNVDGLARCIMSEASIGNSIEQTAIGFACQRNLKHASNQRPTPKITQLAKDILEGRVHDPTRGANHWYSPYSMPKENEKSKCKRPIGTGHMDCRGGLEQACDGKKNYKPSWANSNKQVDIPDVRACRYKFFKL
ncbi:unnamed protein product [Adineta steineri]|uniref:Uncharacterized protein n=1 Tax=Adineta steineri TaxID=433720 RepID=A0A819PIK4_9BILA|nr:unnamed protein product [Adineta steineri]